MLTSPNIMVDQLSKKIRAKIEELEALVKREPEIVENSMIWGVPCHVNENLDENDVVCEAVLSPKRTVELKQKMLKRIQDKLQSSFSASTPGQINRIIGKLNNGTHPNDIDDLKAILQVDAIEHKKLAWLKWKISTWQEQVDKRSFDKDGIIEVIECCHSLVLAHNGGHGIKLMYRRETRKGHTSEYLLQIAREDETEMDSFVKILNTLHDTVTKDQFADRTEKDFFQFYRLYKRTLSRFESTKALVQCGFEENFEMSDRIVDMGKKFERLFCMLFSTLTNKGSSCQNVTIYGECITPTVHSTCNEINSICLSQAKVQFLMDLIYRQCGGFLGVSVPGDLIVTLGLAAVATLVSLFGRVLPSIFLFLLAIGAGVFSILRASTDHLSGLVGEVVKSIKSNLAPLLKFIGLYAESDPDRLQEKRKAQSMCLRDLYQILQRVMANHRNLLFLILRGNDRVGYDVVDVLDNEDF